MTSIYVVILNWNGWRDTVACLKSMQKLQITNYKLQIILVDNASTNESVTKLQDYIKNIKNIELIENKENLGFAGGNNVGIKYALLKNADYVCVLNNDTEVSKNFFSGLLQFAKEHPNLGVVSPKMYFYKGFEFHKDRYKKHGLGKVVWYGGGSIDWSNVYGSNARVDEVDVGQLVDTETDFATGACMFFPSGILRDVGLFNEKYYLYLEDAELSMRIKRAGYQVWFANKPYLWHKVSQSSAIGSSLNDYFITRNRLLFGIAYAPIRAKFALLRESVRFIFSGREWQKRGALDFYLRKFGKGSWE